MAQSPQHKFGQTIGEILEVAVEPFLRGIATEFDLYLDKKGPRRPARSGAKVIWEDVYEIKHDLDFVLERGGSTKEYGRPVAFFETAWRNYTKHSRNKVQEIQGAVLPIIEKHRLVAPFAGAVLAGVFTAEARTSLERRFTVLYLEVDKIKPAFDAVGIDIEFGEATPRQVIAERVAKLAQVPQLARNGIAEQIVRDNESDFGVFREQIRKALMKQVKSVLVVPLHGNESTFETVDEAIRFLGKYGAGEASLPVRLYEVVIRFTNEGKADGQFPDKDQAIAFLELFRAPLTPVR